MPPPAVTLKRTAVKGGGGGGGGGGKRSGIGGAPPKPVDPFFVAELARLGYLPEAVTDITTEFVLRKLNQTTAPVVQPTEQLLGCPSAKELAASSRCGSFMESAKVRALEPVMLVMHMPWFRVHTGHIRAWALLHTLRYPCLFSLLALRMVILVQPGELSGCERICALAKDACTCRVAQHDRAFQHRNLMELATGHESILYAHADTWINLPRMRAFIDEHRNHSLSPSRGLQGTSYTPTRSRCLHPSVLNQSREWFWHLDSKPQCLKANAALGEDALGAGGARAWRQRQHCCYAWVDIAYIPRLT